jgi:hypothetical protein
VAYALSQDLFSDQKPPMLSLQVIICFVIGLIHIDYRRYLRLYLANRTGITKLLKFESRFLISYMPF